MKLFIKLILTLLVLAVVLPFTPLLSGDKPLIKWSDVKMPRLKTAQQPPELSGGTPDRSRIQTFYKWKDANGEIHYSDEPPKGNADGLSTVEVNPDANLLPAVDTESSQPTPENKPKATAKSDAPSTYSPEAIKRLFEDARKLQETVNQRNKMLDEVSGETKK